MLKVLIIDDETGMRTILKKIIDKISGVSVVGEAEDGKNGFRLYMETSPEIVFLDVEMGNTSGLDCAQKIFEINPKAFIIFATAHEEYMSKAFEVYAFDYILKPFKIGRVIQTVERLKGICEGQYGLAIQKESPKKKRIDKLLIRNKESTSFVNIEDIILVERENRNTVIHTESEKFITSDGLSEIEEKLDKNTFYRSHKSYIINISRIHKIYPYGRWTYLVKFLNTEKDALITHEKYEELQKIFDS